MCYRINQWFLNPQIITKDAESVITLFEALGFERHHRIVVTEKNGREIITVRMKDSNDFYIDVIEMPVERDLMSIRLNVSDFEEAFDLLTGRGFRIVNTDGDVMETQTNRSVMMMSPSGFVFHLVKHIKE